MYDQKRSGKGFAGAMKRWNFSGLRASHGVSVALDHMDLVHEIRQDPGKVFKASGWTYGDLI